MKSLHLCLHAFLACTLFFQSCGSEPLPPAAIVLTQPTPPKAGVAESTSQKQQSINRGTKEELLARAAKPIQASPKPISTGFTPPPIVKKHLPLKEGEGKKAHEEWLLATHKTEPGVDWKSVEANSIRQVLAANKTASITSTLRGTWKERGPTNIPGRITDLEIDYTNNQMYALSDHGIVFRSDDLKGKNWKAMNDQFPLALDVTSQMELFDGGTIVVSGWIKVDNFWGVYQSTDGGQTWSRSKGFSPRIKFAIRRMSKQADTLYVLMHEYDFNIGRDFYVVYKSTDKGVNFTSMYESPIPAGDGGRSNKSDMWVPDDPTYPDFYLALEDSLFTVNKLSGQRQFQSIISGRPVGTGLLTGQTQNGVTTLHAYVASRDTGWFYSWSSTQPNWEQKGKLTDWWLAFPFGSNSFSCSKKDPKVVYFGGILISKSNDGGKNWITMDLDPTGSYALYHGDVPKTMTTIDPKTQEEAVYIGTDGGIYQLDSKEHFNSISIPGLNCTQIYKMVSRQHSPGEMFIGTQDNGYAHTALGTAQPEKVDFTFQWGGDVTNVATGDGGKTFWLWWLGDGCNYMTEKADAYSTWSPYDFQGGIPYWEAPVWIPSQYPDRCYTAGFLNNSQGNYLIELKANEKSQATPKQFDYNFEAEVGGRISAIAISPLDENYYYVSTANGYFCHSSDEGKTWKKTFISGSFYGKVIYPSKLRLGEVWVGGSGFSNAPLYHTLNHGVQFEPFQTGLPRCMFEALDANEDESVLFAATSVGPFAYETAAATWESIMGTDGLMVHHMDVEYLPTLKTARFATYARGVWDYVLQPITSVADSPVPQWSLFHHTATGMILLQTGPELMRTPFQIVNSAGKLVHTGIFEDTVTEVDVNSFLPGVYFVLPQNKKGYSILRFVR